jgi:hypothetical protein
VSRFWAGFGIASAVWAAAGAYLYFGLGMRPPEEEIAIAEPPPVIEEPAPVEEEQPRQRRRRRLGGARAANEERTPTGNATTGDELGDPGMRMIDGEGQGGEEQLTSAQIESAFDGGMGRIRRCLVLMAGSDPVTGRVTFGMRIGPDGSVRAVQLSGPAAATTGEAGDCLRTSARAIRFPSFDGPEMIVRYPLTLE